MDKVLRLSLCAAVLFACGRDSKKKDNCGNSALDSGEQCDGSDLNGATCQTQNFLGGTLKCSGCRFDKTACIGGCGNSVREASEVCDARDLVGETCVTKGFDTGTLTCNSDCAGYNTSGCTIIGGERCQDGVDNDGDSLSDCADSDCAARCADACAAPQVAALPSTINGSNVGHADSATPSCRTNDGPDVAYRVQAPDNGTLNITLDSVADLILYVQTQCGSSAGELGCTDVGVSNDQEYLSVSLTAGQVAFVMVDGYSGQSSTFSLTLDFVIPGCGNNIIEGNEVCDGTDRNGQTCASRGFASGNLSCNGNCDGFDTTGCVPAVCGNNVAEGNEVCDGTDLSGNDCISVNFVGGGTLTCPCDSTCPTSGSCAFDTSQCRLNACVGAPAAADPSITLGTTDGLGSTSDGSCQSGAGPDFVYQVTPAATGILRVGVSSEADLGVYVQNTCGDANTEMACSDFSGGGSPDGLQIAGVAGTPVSVLVGGYTSSASGPFKFGVEGAAITTDSDCGDLFDNDSDSLIDCEDPDCGITAACTPGSTATGGACATANTCVANANDPACLSELVTGSPGGQCTEFCNLAAPDCSGDAECVNLGLPSGAGVCFDGCVGDPDCRAGYSCGLYDATFTFISACVGNCTDNTQCPTTGLCDTTSGRCAQATTETEVNDGYTTADAYVQPFNAAIDTAGDIDYVSVSIPGPSSTLIAEVVDMGSESCPLFAIDSQLEIFGTNGTTSLALDDDSGAGFCSKASVSNLAAGTYYVAVSSNPTYASFGQFLYRLNVTVQ